MKDQEKRKQIKEWDLEVWTAFAPKVKAHEKNSDAYWCYCPHCEKGKRRLVSTTSLGWSIRTAMEMVWVLPARHVGQSIPGSMHSSAKVLQQQRNMQRNALRLVPWVKVGIALPHNAISSRRSKKSEIEQRNTRRTTNARGESARSPTTYATLRRSQGS